MFSVELCIIYCKNKIMCSMISTCVLFLCFAHLWILSLSDLLFCRSSWFVFSSSLAVLSSCSYTFSLDSFHSRIDSICFVRNYRQQRPFSNSRHRKNDKSNSQFTRKLEKLAKDIKTNQIVYHKKCNGNRLIRISFPFPILFWTLPAALKFTCQSVSWYYLS